MASLALELPVEASAGGYHLLEIGVDTEITILEMGNKLSYRIPSFSVINVDIRQITYQVLSGDGTVLKFDGFIHADSGLIDKHTPFTIQLKDYCFVTVSW